MSRSLFSPPPEPKTPLGRYRLLGPNCGLRVSPIQLGAGNIGDKWEQYGYGAMNKESSFKLLDAYFDAGGNFIDTANSYQGGSSEEFIGEWAEQRGIRDQLVIATKYSMAFKQSDDSVPIKVNYAGNSLKSLYLSVEASLAKLRTDYIDILYVHMWDYTTPLEEVMNGLHSLVVARKVLYLGISDSPAWIVAKANEYAKHCGRTPFVIYQGKWNVMVRDFERDIIPMAHTLGLALAPFEVVGGGKFRTDAEEERRRQTGERGRMLVGIIPNWERNEQEKKVSSALEKVAKEVGTDHISAVAIAYVLHKTPHVFPIVGGRKVEQLYANIEALKINLSLEQIRYLESVTLFSPGFPHNLIGNGSKPAKYVSASGHLDLLPKQQPLKPSVKL